MKLSCCVYSESDVGMVVEGFNGDLEPEKRHKHDFVKRTCTYPCLKVFRIIPEFRILRLNVSLKMLN